jgi:transposase
MSERSRKVAGLTMGLDISDRNSLAVVLDEAGEVVEEIKVPTTEAGLRRLLSGRPACRVALEVGTHSPWISSLAAELGHEVIVANARQVALISQSGRKSDRVDAEALARLARTDARLLSPIQHRGRGARRDLMLIRSRDALVASRTQLVNHVRHQVKVWGQRLPSCSTEAFASKVKGALPAELQSALAPIVEAVGRLSAQIRAYDAEVERLCTEVYPETARLRQVSGVGSLTALGYVLTLESPARFRKGRDVGAYLGLVPRRRQSGDCAPELRISKAGDKTLRRLLVGASHYILGPFGPDTDLRRWGLGLAGRGGKTAKKRAIVATARKLAVLLLALWRSGSIYEPQRAPRQTAHPVGACA